MHLFRNLSSAQTVPMATERTRTENNEQSLSDLSIVTGVGNNKSLAGLPRRLMKDQTAQHRWDNLSLKRSIYLRRAIDCSSLTIPR